jgi:hypothetical protein
MAVRDMTPEIGAQIEDKTPSIRLLLQQALAAEPTLVDAEDVTEPELFPKDRGGRPRLSEWGAMRSALVDK